MNQDEQPLTLAPQHRLLEAEIRHAEVLHRDAVCCGLSDLAKRRRARLQALNRMLRGLDNEDAGDSERKRA